MDIRVLPSCSPYPRAENQGDSVSCVAFAFAAALYCSIGNTRPASSAVPPSYPHVQHLFRTALSRSPSPSRGVTFRGIMDVITGTFKEELLEARITVDFIDHDLGALQDSLRAGFPVVLGYQVNAVTRRFHEDAAFCKEAGYLLPSFSDDSEALSAHTVLCVGFDDSVGALICRNSWGDEWGFDGHFWIAYADAEDPSHITDAASFRSVRPSGRSS